MADITPADVTKLQVETVKDGARAAITATANELKSMVDQLGGLLNHSADSIDGVKKSIDNSLVSLTSK